MNRFAWLGVLMTLTLPLMAEDKPASPLTGSLPLIDGTQVDLARHQALRPLAHQQAEDVQPDAGRQRFEREQGGRAFHGLILQLFLK